MGKGSHKGQKGEKGGKGGKRDERLVRTDELEARYNATPASTSTNATHFIFVFHCLCDEFLYLLKIT